MIRDSEIDFEPLRQAHHRTVAPAEFQSHVRLGMEKGKKRRRHAAVFRLAGFAAALLIMMAITMSIRFSPPVAAWVGKIPVLNMLTEAFGPIKGDAGLKTAAEHDYMQYIGQTVEHEGLKLTLNYAIADEARIIAFYSIEDHAGYKLVENVQGVWKDGSTKQPVMGSVFRGELEPWTKGGLTNGYTEIHLQKDAVIPKLVELELTMNVQRQEGEPLHRQEETFLFELNHDLFRRQKEVVSLNQTISLGGQQVTFLQAVLLPTATRIDFTLAPDNSKQVFAIEDLRLIDDQGKEWKPLSYYDFSRRGSYIEKLKYEPESARAGSRDPITVYFEGNYLERPKALTLTGSRIRALEKEKLEVLVDLDEEKLLKAPDKRIRLASAKLHPQLLEVIFEVPARSDYTSFEGYDMARIRSTEEFELGLTGDSGICSASSYLDVSEETETLCFRTKYQGIDLRPYLDHPLRFYIYDYGYNKLHHPFSVRIK